MKSGAQPSAPTSVVNVILGGGGGPGSMAAKMFPDQVGKGPRGQALKEAADGRRQGTE
jgi:hypothetical protein